MKNMPEKRIFKVVDPNTGQENEVEIISSVEKPIVHENIPDFLLERIRDIWETIKPYYVGNFCLEQFEVQFMRNLDMEKEIISWEKILFAWQKLCAAEPYSTTEDKRFFLQVYMLNALGDLTDAQKETALVKKILSYLNEE